MSSEKTEEPTPKKLRDARKKGQVAHSKDVTSTALLIAIFFYLAAGWNWIKAKLLAMITLPGTLINRPFEQALEVLSSSLLTDAIELCLPLLAIVILTGIAFSVAQTGPLLSLEPVKPELKKLNPFDKLKQLCSMKNLMEFLKSLIKVTVLAVVLTLLIRDLLQPLVHATNGSLEGVIFCLESACFYLALHTSVAYLVLAGLDYWFQRRQYIKGLRMSKDEIKREYKESEGDPHIKGKRKHLHQEMVMGDMPSKVKKATVLVTNPTHKAVALFYKQDETPLPRIEAKGEDFMAQQMIKIAQESGVPIVRNIPLAWALYDTGEIADFIPVELIQPVAEVLRFVAEITDQPQNSSL